MDNQSLEIKIRKEEPADYPAVYNINCSAFEGRAEARLADRLRLCNAFVPELSLVATYENKTVGHIMFTKIVIIGDNKEFPSLALAPVAVAPHLQRKGIGSLRVRYGLEKAHQLGYKSVIVLGYEEFYLRFGFSPTTKWQIKAPFNVPSNVFMGLELEENGLAGVSGTVKYAKEFEDI